MADGVTSTLKALAWLRWRLFVNGSVHAMRRDLLRRFAGWAQPVTLAAMGCAFVPSGIVLSLVAVAFGWAVVSHEIADENARTLLRIGTLFFVLGGVVMPIAHGGRSALPAISRLLLLPIDRRLLHRMHFAAGLFEPVLLFLTFPVILMPLGMAVGGRLVGAVLALVAGVCLVLFEAGIGSWLYSWTVLFLSRRQRAQTIFLVVVCTACVLGFTPLLFQNVSVPPEVVERLWLLNPPGELYTLAVTGAADGDFLPALAGVLGLALAAAGVYRLSRHAYGRVLVMTAGSAPSSPSKPMELQRTLWLPGLGKDASLVASYQLRMALRTVVGKTALLQPSLMVGLFGVLLLRARSELPELVTSNASLLLLLFAAGLAVLGPMSFQFNQFALDRGGATQLALLPLAAEGVVHGKAAAHLLLAAAGFAPAAVMAVLFTRPDPLAALTAAGSAGLILLSSQFLLAPVAVVASALLPRAVNFNKPFTESQPHNLAVLAGLFTAPFAVSLAGALALTGVFVFESRLVALFLLCLWTVATFLIARILLPATTELYRRRRETLLLTAQNRR